MWRPVPANTGVGSPDTGDHKGRPYEAFALAATVPPKICRTPELREQLAEAEDRVWALETRLRETQASTSYRLARSLVLAAKSPLNLWRLPAQLWRFHKARGTREDVVDSAPRRLAIPSPGDATVDA